MLEIYNKNKVQKPWRIVIPLKETNRNYIVRAITHDDLFSEALKYITKNKNKVDMNSPIVKKIYEMNKKILMNDSIETMVDNKTDNEMEL